MSACQAMIVGLMLLVLGGPAMAAPDGFTPLKTTDACELYRGPANANGVQPVRAECHWPDAKLPSVEALLGEFSKYAELIPPIDSCTVLRWDGSRALVHQVMTARGISPREVHLWMETIPLDGGGHRYSWETATDEPVTPQRGNVAAVLNDGFWEVRAHPEGGVRIVHQVAYDPGGFVPGWVVKSFQTTGMIDLMEQMHARAVKASR